MVTNKSEITVISHDKGYARNLAADLDFLLDLSSAYHIQAYKSQVIKEKYFLLSPAPKACSKG